MRRDYLVMTVSGFWFGWLIGGLANAVGEERGAYTVTWEFPVIAAFIFCSFWILGFLSGSET